MNYIVLGKYIFIGLLLFILQLFFPSIYIEGYKTSPDFFLLLITFLAFKIDRLGIVIIGFFLGIIQDTISQIQLFGIFALIKTNIGFIISTLSKFYPIWTKSILFLSISISYFLHFLIYFFIKLNGTQTEVFISIKLILINTFINIVFLYLIDKTLFPMNNFDKK